MLKTLINYLKYSGAFITLALNPRHWRLNAAYLPPTDADPKMHIWKFAIGPVKIVLAIDDGSW